MALKYFFEHYSVDDKLYRCEISSDSYIGSSVEIEGNITNGLNKTEGVTYAIKSKYARLELLATSIENLEDLFNDEERYWSVKLYQDSALYFFGYLTSEGSYQDFVRDKWKVTLEALSPIAYLQELAYVDGVGANYEGRDTLIKIISNALKRGFTNSGDEFDILTYCPLGYKQINLPLVDNGNFLSEVSLNQDIWVDLDSGEASDCQTVLFDLLDSLGLSIAQIEGNTWLIYDSLYDLRTIDSKYINKFDSDGIQIVDDLTNRFAINTIKSDSPTISDLDLMHVNENQTYTYRRTVSSVAVDFQYIASPQFIENPELIGGTSPRTLPNWTFLQAPDSSYQSSVSSLGYIILEGILTSDANKKGVTTASDKRYVQKGEFLTLKADIDYRTAVEQDLFGHRFGVVLVTATTTYYLFENFNQLIWSETPLEYQFVATGRIDLEVVMPEIPEDGELGIELHPVQFTTLNGTPTIVPAYLYYVDLVPSEGNAIGNTYTGKSTVNTKGKATKEEIKISTAISYSVSNALYRNTEPLEGVFHHFLNKTVDLGEIAVNRFLIQGKKRIYFTGSVRNPIDVHQYFEIVEISGNTFRIEGYEFDTYENIGFLELVEVNSSPITYDYDKLPIYGATIKPTIVS